MDEKIIIEQGFVDLAKAAMAKDPALRPCNLCYYFDAEKKWCSFIKKPKMHYNYGAACFVTNEQALKALLLKERKRAMAVRTKFHEKLDVMNIMVSGADMIREDLMEILEAEYKGLVIKAKTDDATYKKSKKNLDRLAKCYGKMKVLMQDFESEYRNFIGYWDAQMFEDENGVYDREYDKKTHNVGFCTYFFFALYEKLFMSQENVETLVKCLNGMTGKDIWDEGDLKRYLIKI